jgi:hypothetical protein
VFWSQQQGASVFTCQISKTKGEKYAVKQDATDSLQSYPNLVRKEGASSQDEEDKVATTY